MNGRTVVGVEVLRGLQAHLTEAGRVAVSAQRYREAREYLQCARMLRTYSRALQTTGYLAPSLLWVMSRDTERAGDLAQRRDWAELDTLDTVATGLAALAEFLEESARV